MDARQLDRVLSPEVMTQPGIVDEEIKAVTGSRGWALCCAFTLAVAIQAPCAGTAGGPLPADRSRPARESRPCRVAETRLIMDALKIADGDTVADIGAGSGLFTVRLARRVDPRGENGLVYAEDIQQPMLESIKTTRQP